MKVVILNDCSMSKHAGCILTMNVYAQECRRRDVEYVTIPMNSTVLDVHFPLFSQADLLIINGEGSIHHNKRGELIQIARDFPAVLVNCVYQENIDRQGLDKFLYKSARESYSAKALGCDVVPDVVFLSTLSPARYPEQKPRLGMTDSVMGTEVSDIKIHQEPFKYLRDLACFCRICTGRFHGIVLCAKYGIPFSAYASNTWKNEALMHDMGVSHLYNGKRQDAKELAPEEMPESVEKYVDEAPKKVGAMFDKILSLSCK